MEDKGKSVSQISVQEEIEMLKKKIQEVDQEAEFIRAKFLQEENALLQANEEEEIAEEDIIELSLAEKEEIDSRSVYVGNVEYGCTPEEVQQHFEGCGLINRVTILIDEFGTPKGYAFVEFAETQSVQNALGLNGSELCDRQIKVSPKRTNIPGMGQRRFPSGSFMMGPPFNPSYGYGRFPRYKANIRYSPY